MPMHKRIGILLCWFAAHVLCFAQTDVATVLRTVTDASGAVAPAAKIKLENVDGFQAPASNISNNTFGTITSTLPARQIQMAVKFIF